MDVFFGGVAIYRIYKPTDIPRIGVFDDAVLYSLVYNGVYMLPCMVPALAVADVLYTPMKKFFAGQDLRK